MGHSYLKILKKIFANQNQVVSISITNCFQKRQLVEEAFRKKAKVPSSKLRNSNLVMLRE